jgi:hypothetical protein
MKDNRFVRTTYRMLAVVVSDWFIRRVAASIRYHTKIVMIRNGLEKRTLK